MLQLHNAPTDLTYFRSNTSFEETLFRLEHAIARSPWQVAARVDMGGVQSPRGRRARLVVLRPILAAEPAAADLTWSLMLPNELLVCEEVDGTVLVGYHRPRDEQARAGLAHLSAANAWHALELLRGLREAAGAAAGAPARSISDPMAAQAAE
jgi:uncharacterized protein (DUF302 family)